MPTLPGVTTTTTPTTTTTTTAIGLGGVGLGQQQQSTGGGIGGVGGGTNGGNGQDGVVVQSASQRQESSRQASEDISWEFTINEAPIARLESLDELDQDHGS